jgi:uncharacterized protein
VLRAEGACHWHGGNPFVTHFFNALSIMFPEGERFFVGSVRRFEHRVEDPRLPRR